MATLRKSKNRKNGSAWERLCGSFFSSERSSLKDRKPRRLLIDSLEQRQLLSVSVVNAQDMLINQNVSDSATMVTGKSVATDSNGDFVTVWSQNDGVYDSATGQPVNDPSTGKAMTDLNVYARYFTNAVQRVDLPAGATSFQLQYNGNEIQKLTISAGSTPFTDPEKEDPISGTFDLAYGGKTATVDFDETGSPVSNVGAIQSALRSMDLAALSDVTVTAIDAEHYLINFGNASEAKVQSSVDQDGVWHSDIGIENIDLSGFLPSVDLSSVRTPGTTITIPIGATPATTAANIEYAFSQTSQNISIAPVTVSQPTDDPATLRTAMPAVSVKAISATEFDITFTGDSGTQQQPLLVVLDSEGEVLSGATVKVLKQSSDAFRVNAPEPDDPSSLRPDQYDQKNAQVAMTPDGDFIITWQSVVPNSVNFGSGSDIFARIFSPAQYSSTPTFIADMTHAAFGGYPIPDGIPETPIAGVVPLSNQFQVNTLTTNPQADPTVGIDQNGNFTIAWDGMGQGYSFFNLISAQRFDRDGNKLGTEFVVNSSDNTTGNNQPYVAVSRDGVIAVAWYNVQNQQVQAKIFASNGAVVVGQFVVSAGASPSVAFDAINDFTVAWEMPQTDSDNVGGPSTGVYAQQYQIFNPGTGAVDPQIIRGIWRVNSASYTATNTTWPNDQSGSQVASDADGDLTVVYSGFGPDVSETDVSQKINAELVKLGADATPEELAAERAAQEAKYGLLRGEANGALFSQFDADPRLIDSRILASDSVANNNRDGQNSTYYLDIDTTAVSGEFSLVLNGQALVDITPIFGATGLDADNTALAIQSALYDEGFDGTTLEINWPIGQYKGPVVVSLLSEDDLDALTGTKWDPALGKINTEYSVFKITFQGEVHDTQIGLSLATSTLKKKVIVEGEEEEVDADAPTVVEETYGKAGTQQKNVSIAMTPDGNFIETWQETTLLNDGSSGVTNLYFRQFSESTDTAGPIVTRVSAAGDTRIDSGTPVTVLGGLQHVVVTFDQQMLDNATHTGDAVTNPLNYRLLRNGVEVIGGIATVQYGLNMASQLAASDSAAYADLTLLPAANRWEAVLTIDGNGTLAGSSALDNGTYTIQELAPVAPTALNPAGRSGLRDTAGNVLGRTGFAPAGPTGGMYAQTFSVLTTQPDPGVGAGGGSVANGRTYPEAPGAVAVDGDGDQIVVFTAPDPANGGVDRVYVRLYNADGSSSALAPVALAVAPSSKAPQRYATVACDGDGDFVVTWTQYDSPTDANIYGQRFNSVGVAQGDAFKINTYAASNQEWSNVAMNTSGDFVVTWSSLGQEDNGQMGSGYGVYARRYDSSGSPLAPEFQVNVTTAGSQQNSTVSLADNGMFVVAWQSSQNGVNDDIIARVFGADGTPLLAPSPQVPAQNSPLTSEVRVLGATGTKDNTAGNQRYPDVAMNLAGTKYVVTWQSSAQDGSGWGIYSRNFDVNLPPTKTYSKTDGTQIPNGGEIASPLQVSDDVRIEDISATLNIITPHPADLTVWLTGPGDDPNSDPNDPNFTGVLLFSRVPVGSSTGQNFIGTTLSDSGLTSIDDETAATNPAVPPFTNTYRPTQPLSKFTGQAAKGTWILHIRDNVELPLDNQYLQSWSLTIKPAQSSTVAPVNTTTLSDQMYPSVAMAYDGSYAIAWSGNGSQNNQVDSSGVFYQRFNPSGGSIGTETRANNVTVGNQWIPSIGSDSQGNVVVVWTGDTGTGNARDVYKYTGLMSAPVDDNIGSIVTGVMLSNRAPVSNGGVVQPPAPGTSQLIVAFDENLNAEPYRQTKLTASITASATTIQVDAATSAAFPTSGPFTIVVDNEQMSVTAGFGTTTWTVTRHTNSTSAASHSLGATVLGDPVLYAHSVLNPLNWSLYRNGSDITGAITIDSFALNPATRKWEAVLKMQDGSPLTAANYTLVVSDRIWDAARNHDSATNTYSGNFLDGDFDGKPETDPNYSPQPVKTYSTQAGYSIDFTVVDPGTPQVGAEYRVNSTTGYDTQTSQVLGTGTAREQTTRSVAADHSGNFAVVWTSFGQDDPSNPQGAGVYMRMFDRNNIPLTSDILVNTFTTGDQRNATVAMDADGDFVVVWESQNQGNTSLSSDGSWDVYAQRFNSMGVKVGGEFRVNTNYTNDQLNPAVAMNSFGNFVIVWATGGQPYSYFNDIKGQVFDADGSRVGDELRINSQDIPGTNLTPGSNEVNPSIAMDDKGDFVVTWDQVTQQTNGVVTDTVIVARVFDRTGAPRMATNVTDGSATSNVEFRVNVGDEEFARDGTHEAVAAQGGLQGETDTQRMARNSQVAMDSAGNFIVVWEAFQDNDLGDTPPESYGIYSRRFNIRATAVATDPGTWVAATEVDQQANLTYTDPRDQADRDAATPQQNAAYLRFAGDQANPSIAMDADGDYVISWNGNGATPNPINPKDPLTQSDVDTAGVWIRSFHAKNPNPNASENEAVTVQSRVNITQAGYQQFPSLAMTPSGQVIAVWSGNGVGDQHGVFYRRYNVPTDTAGPMVTDFLLPDGTSVSVSGQVTQSLQAIVVTFDEDMGSSASVAANYQLLKNGLAVSGGINKVYYGLDIANSLGSQYGLNVPKLNKYQAVLIVDGSSQSGVQPLTDGQYTIVATNALRDKVGNPLLGTGLGPNGAPMSGVITVTLPTGQETKVPAGTTPSGATYGKYTSATTASSVASDASGNYVTAWTDTTPGHQGVWAKMYQQTVTLGANGTRTATVTERQVVNPATGMPWVNNEICISADPTATDIAVTSDAAGDFIVTWSAYNSTTNEDIYAALYNSTGKAIRSAFGVNTYTTGVQNNAAVAMDSSGNSIVSWQSLDEDGSGYGIDARRFDFNGAAVGGTNEVQVMAFDKSFTGTFRIRWDKDNNPLTPDVVTAPITYSGNANSIVGSVQTALAAIGADCTVKATGIGSLEIDFTGANAAENVALVWVNFADVTVTTGAAVGAVTTATATGGASGEILVNDTTAGDQMYPDVAITNNGDAVVTWTSYGQARPSTDPSNAFGYDGTEDSATQGNIYAKTLSLPVAPSGFHITLENLSGMTADEIVLAQEAALRWESVIVGALPPATLSDGTITTGIVINLSGAAIDGPNEILGQGAPDQFRPTSNLPSHGTLSFDLADMQSMLARGTLLDTMTHEMGHCLGYGTLWTQLNLLSGATEDDPEFIGKNAVAAYNKMQILGMKALGNDPATASGVPVENTGDEGTRDAHWRETIFTSEIMTGTSNPGVPNPMSDVTVGSMEDLGYTVSYDHVQNNSYEFLVNVDDIFGVDPDTGAISGTSNETGDQSHPSVAMDANGEFVIAWNSYGQDGGSGRFGVSYGGENGVFARRYANGGVVNSNVFQVNQTTPGNQQHPSVAMEPSGDFVVAWESGSDDANYDVYVRWYAKNSAVNYESIDITTGQPTFPIPASGSSSGTNLIVGTNPIYGPNGEMGGEVLVNSTTSGNQRYPSVSVDDAGDAVVIWCGNGEVAGQSDPQGVFFQRFAAATDDAPPTVAKVQSVDSTGAVATVVDGQTIGATVPYFVVTFSEAVSQALVQNVNNWSLTLGGATLAGGIANVQYGLNKAHELGLTSTDSGHYEAVLTFDSDITTSGKQPLSGGSYKLTLSDAVRDLSGNALDGDYSGRAGGAFDWAFTVPGTGGNSGNGTDKVTQPGEPTSGSTDVIVSSSPVGTNGGNPDVAMNTNGDYVVVWNTMQYGDSDVAYQRYDKAGNAVGAQVVVNTHATTKNAQGNTIYTPNGDQTEAAVAMDSFGDFVIVWSGKGTGDDTGIFAQIYDKSGKAIGSTIMVNQFAQNVQSQPAVAMDANGDFVVAWTSVGQDGDSSGVYARRFTVLGQAVTKEIPVNTYTTSLQDTSSVSMDAVGNFIVTWQSWGIDGSQWGIYGQRFGSVGNKLGSEFVINTYTTDKQQVPSVSMNAKGKFVVTWEGFGQDGSGYGIYARRYDAAGTALDAKEVLVNQTTANWQISPDAAMFDDDSFAVTWSSYGQDNTAKTISNPTQDYGIYARRFNADGSGDATGEYRVNAYTVGNQITPAVAASPTGNHAIVWAGPSASDPKAIDIFGRLIDQPATSSVITPGAQSFALTGPTSGTYAKGSAITINWTSANVKSGSKISLCYDTDASFNGNEKWIEIDNVGASNGTGSFAWNTANLAAGTYYVGGYLWDGGATFTNSHLSQAIAVTIPVQSFSLTNPTATSVTAGSPVTIGWTAGDVVAGSVISLCYDTDTTFNKNEKWIEIDAVAASNGAGTFTWNTPTTLPNGTYYLGGYMWDRNGTFTNSHASQAITVTGSQVPGPQSFSLTNPTVTSVTAGSPVTIGWTAGNVVAGSKISLCFDTDTTFNKNEKWIEIDAVAAANGAGTFTWNTPATLPNGTYYLGGYMWDRNGTFTNSHSSTVITVTGSQAPAVPSFTLTGPTSGTYNAGDNVAISYTAGGTVASGRISLCYDTDTVINKNEKWIEIDAVNATDGSKTYSWNTANVPTGTYYVAGYMWDGGIGFYNSHLTQSITINGAPSTAQVFAVSGPTSGSYAVGSSVTIGWTASNVVAGSAISFCYDTDTTFNGNEKWIEIDQVAAANGSYSYTWNTTGAAAGTYYVAGYMYDWKGTFTRSHLTQAITLTGGSNSLTGGSNSVKGGSNSVKGVAASAATNAVFANLGASTSSNSAKADWLYGT